MKTTIDVPRINANEDSLKVVGIHAKVGDAVRRGDILVTLESTKAASDVEATVDGTIAAIHAVLDEMIDVGAPLLVLEGEGAAGAGPQAAEAETAPAEVAVSAKARQRAKELGVDLAKVAPRDGRIRVEDVEAAAAKGVSAPAVAEVAPVAPGGVRAVIVGGGGHARTIVDALAGSGYAIVGCTDESLPAGTPVLGNIQVLGTSAMLPELFAQGVRVAFIGVGGATDNNARKRIFEDLLAQGFTLPPAVHRTAYIGLDSTIGAAVFVGAGASIGAACTVGANAMVNQGSILCHDCRIGAHAHLTPGAVLAGNVEIGEGATIGMAATVLFGSRIGAGSLVHNGAMIAGDVADNMEVTHDGKRLKRG